MIYDITTASSPPESPPTAPFRPTCGRRTPALSTPGVYECLRPHVSSLSDDISFLRTDYIALLLTIYSRLKEDNDLVAMDEIMDTIDELTLTDVGSYEDLIFNLKEENS